MSVRFAGQVEGHEVVLDSDESLVVVDRLRLFIDSRLVDERKSIGGTMKMQATVDDRLWDVEVRSGAVIGSVKAVSVSVDGRATTALRDESG